MALSDRMRKTASRILTSKGRSVLYRSVSPGTDYDTTTGSETVLETNYSIMAAQIPPGSDQYNPFNLTPGLKRTWLVAALSLPVDPKPGDIVSVDGAEERVTQASPVYADEQAVLWYVGVEA